MALPEARAGVDDRGRHTAGRAVPATGSGGKGRIAMRSTIQGVMFLRLDGLPGRLPGPVEIDVAEGRVILTGEAEASEAALIRELAYATHGVIEVEDNLRVRRPEEVGLMVGLD
jgi:hypothetical protein